MVLEYKFSILGYCQLLDKFIPGSLNSLVLLRKSEREYTELISMFPLVKLSSLRYVLYLITFMKLFVDLI